MKRLKTRPFGGKALHMCLAGSLLCGFQVLSVTRVASRSTTLTAKAADGGGGPSDPSIEVGDPSQSGSESVRLTPQQENALQLLMKGKSRGTEVDHRKIALKMVKMAQLYVGVSRRSNRPQVTEFLNLFGLGYSDPQNGRPYAFCAAGISYAACQAYCELEPYEYKQHPLATFRKALKDINHYYFQPSPQCVSIQRDALRRGTWISRAAVQLQHVAVRPGWLVLYNWHDGKKRLDQAEHIGIVVQAEKAGLHTIEFNTSGAKKSDGGAVAERPASKRPYRFVLGYVRTYGS